MKRKEKKNISPSVVAICCENNIQYKCIFKVLACNCGNRFESNVDEVILEMALVKCINTVPVKTFYHVIPNGLVTMLI